jgi:hypothetical protein
MAKKKFNFGWKLTENYSAAAVGVLFIWLFVTGIIDGDVQKIFGSIAILAVAPFLVTFLDKKSSE